MGMIWSYHWGLVMVMPELSEISEHIEPVNITQVNYYKCPLVNISLHLSTTTGIMLNKYDCYFQREQNTDNLIAFSQGTIRYQEKDL